MKRRLKMPRIGIMVVISLISMAPGLVWAETVDYALTIAEENRMYGIAKSG